MTVEAVLGLDVGTTSIKAVIMSAAGAVLAGGRSDPIITLSPEPGAAEQDPEQLWSALTAASSRAVADAGNDVRVGAVAMAAQSGSVVPIGSDGRPITNAITWMDTRSGSLVDSWPAADATLIRSVSGWSPSPGLGLATVAWLRDHHPDLYTALARVASVDDFLGHRLTGVWATNPSNAAGLQLMDVDELEWSDALCSRIGLGRDQLSPIRSSGELLGHLVPDAAAAMSLGDATPLIVGGHDQACAALGLGARAPGSVVVSAGTAWVLTAVTDRVDVDHLPRQLNLSPHVVKDRWSASQNLGGLGAVIDWWQNEAYGPDDAPDQMELDLAGAPTLEGAPFFVPALTDESRTAWGRFEPEGTEHGRAECTRAVIEAAAFEVRQALTPIARSVIEPTSLTLVGGAARSRQLRRILADATGLPIVVPGDASWPAIGATRIAASTRGWPDPQIAPATSERTDPDRTAATDLDARFEAYRRLVTGTPT